MALTFDNVDRTRLTPMMMQLIEQKEKYPIASSSFASATFTSCSSMTRLLRRASLSSH